MFFNKTYSLVTFEVFGKSILAIFSELGDIKIFLPNKSTGASIRQVREVQDHKSIRIRNDGFSCGERNHQLNLKVAKTGSFS